MSTRKEKAIVRARARRAAAEVTGTRTDRRCEHGESVCQKGCKPYLFCPHVFLIGMVCSGCDSDGYPLDLGEYASELSRIMLDKYRSDESWAWAVRQLSVGFNAMEKLLEGDKMDIKRDAVVYLKKIGRIPMIVSDTARHINSSKDPLVTCRYECNGEVRTIMIREEELETRPEKP